MSILLTKKPSSVLTVNATRELLMFREQFLFFSFVDTFSSRSVDHVSRCYQFSHLPFVREILRPDQLVHV